MVWRWRNGRFFICKIPYRRVAQEIYLPEEFLEFPIFFVGSLNRAQIVRNLTWQLPEEGWVKLNIDRALTNNGSIVLVGGVVRDCNGGWFAGFIMNIGVCSMLNVTP